MHFFVKKKKFIFLRFFIAVSFLLMPLHNSFAQGLFLPNPQEILSTSSCFVPLNIKGMSIYPDNPLQFDFIIDTGENNFNQEQIKKETDKLIKYFLAALTVPEEELWVNLSPYEEGRVIADGLGSTEMGSDLLAQDYVLKQLTASLMYPENRVGREFWKNVYQKAKKIFGTTKIPVDTFQKVWIVPDDVKIYEQGNSALIINSRLKVMAEQDYIALENNQQQNKEVNDVTIEAIKKVILPEIEREINKGKTFANLRQIYNTLILATWYKEKFKQSLLSKIYVDQNKIKGVENIDPEVIDKIYDKYVEAYTQKLYDYVRKDYDVYEKKTIKRKYAAGGFSARGSSSLRKKVFTGLIVGAGALVSLGLIDLAVDKTIPLGRHETVTWKAEVQKEETKINKSKTTTRTSIKYSSNNQDFSHYTIEDFDNLLKENKITYEELTLIANQGNYNAVFSLVNSYWLREQGAKDALEQIEPSILMQMASEGNFQAFNSLLEIIGVNEETRKAFENEQIDFTVLLDQAKEADFESFKSLYLYFQYSENEELKQKLIEMDLFPYIEKLNQNGTNKAKILSALTELKKIGKDFDLSEYDIDYQNLSEIIAQGEINSLEIVNSLKILMGEEDQGAREIIDNANVDVLVELFNQGESVAALTLVNLLQMGSSFADEAVGELEFSSLFEKAYNLDQTALKAIVEISLYEHPLAKQPFQKFIDSASPSFVTALLEKKLILDTADKISLENALRRVDVTNFVQNKDLKTVAQFYNYGNQSAVENFAQMVENNPQTTKELCQNFDVRNALENISEQDTKYLSFLFEPGFSDAVAQVNNGNVDSVYDLLDYLEQEEYQNQKAVGYIKLDKIEEQAEQGDISSLAALMQLSEHSFMAKDLVVNMDVSNFVENEQWDVIDDLATIYNNQKAIDVKGALGEDISGYTTGASSSINLETEDAFKTMLDLDLEIKDIFANSEPTSFTITSNPERYRKFLQNKFSQAAFRLNEMASLLAQQKGVPGYFDLIVKSKIDQIRNQYLEKNNNSFQVEEFEENFNQAVRLMNQDFVWQVNSQIAGYLNRREENFAQILNQANSLNEILNLMHSYLIQNEDIILSQKAWRYFENKEDMGLIAAYGQKTSLADNLFQLLRGKIQDQAITIYCFNDTIYLLLRDYGHSTSMVINTSEKDKVKINYKVFKTLRLEKIKALRGFEHLDPNGQAATGQFWINADANIAFEINEFIAAIPMDEDFVKVFDHKGKAASAISNSTFNSQRFKNIPININMAVEKTIQMSGEIVDQEERLNTLRESANVLRFLRDNKQDVFQQTISNLGFDISLDDIEKIDVSYYAAGNKKAVLQVKLTTQDKQERSFLVAKKSPRQGEQLFEEGEKEAIEELKDTGLIPKLGKIFYLKETAEGFQYSETPFGEGEYTTRESEEFIQGPTIADINVFLTNILTIKKIRQILKQSVQTTEKTVSLENRKRIRQLIQSKGYSKDKVNWIIDMANMLVKFDSELKIISEYEQGQNTTLYLTEKTTQLLMNIFFELNGINAVEGRYPHDVHWSNVVLDSNNARLVAVDLGEVTEQSFQHFILETLYYYGTSPKHVERILETILKAYSQENKKQIFQKLIELSDKKMVKAELIRALKDQSGVNTKGGSFSTRVEKISKGALSFTRNYQKGQSSSALNNKTFNPGGVNLEGINIEKEGKGNSFSFAGQDLENFNIEGIVPIIVDIKDTPEDCALFQSIIDASLFASQS